MSLVSMNVKNLGNSGVQQAWRRGGWLGVTGTALALAIGIMPSAAWAGGVIIHGHQPAGLNLSTPGLDSDPNAGGDDSTTGEEGSVAEAQKTAEERAREQEVYLWTAALLNGHVPADLSDEDLDDPAVRERLRYMLEAAEADGTQDGCAAAPTSLLTALAGLGLLFRRRRR